VHRSMLEVSELIYDLQDVPDHAGKFILILEAFIGANHGGLLRVAAAISMPSR